MKQQIKNDNIGIVVIKHQGFSQLKFLKSRDLEAKSILKCIKKVPEEKAPLYIMIKNAFYSKYVKLMCHVR